MKPTISIQQRLDELHEINDLFIDAVRALIPADLFRAEFRGTGLHSEIHELIDLFDGKPWFEDLDYACFSMQPVNQIWNDEKQDYDAVPVPESNRWEIILSTSDLYSSASGSAGTTTMRRTLYFALLGINRLHERKEAGHAD